MTESARDKSNRLHKMVEELFSNIIIIENILSHLPLPDLLRTQRVHSYFRDTIKQSSSLQRKLFFKPVPYNLGKSYPKRNPLLVKLFPPLFTLYVQKDQHCFEHVDERCLPWGKDPVMRERMMRPEASWRRMFPIQPPVKLDDIFIKNFSSCVHLDHPAVRARLGRKYQPCQEDGLRMGLLFDLVMKMEAIHLDTTFYVHWQMLPLVERPKVPYDFGWDSDDEVEVMVDYGTFIDEPETIEQLMEETGFDDEESHGDRKLLTAQESWRKIPNLRGEKLRHGITFYHTHDTVCCGARLEPSDLKPSSSFLTAVEAEPRTMLEYFDEPESETWMEYGVMRKDID